MTKHFVIEEEALLGNQEFESMDSYDLDTNTLIKGKKNISNKNMINGVEIINALSLHNREEIDEPKLLDPFLQKVGLASIVGSSDTGKSTFLRQLALSIALGKKDFLGFKLHLNSKNVIYVSTEDDSISTKNANTKQISGLIEDKNDYKDLKHLEFIFNVDHLTKTLDIALSKKRYDLIIIDAFSDIFNKEINSSTQVRNFLMSYHNLAIKYKCLIIFLHHNSKRTQFKFPSKDNIVGSQGFEAKMRSILEIRKTPDGKRHLILLKCNFLPNKFKNIKHVLDFDEETLLFINKKEKIPFNSTSKRSKRNNLEIIKKVLEFKKKGYSLRKIESTLKGSEFEVSKSVINKIINDQKK